MRSGTFAIKMDRRGRWSESVSAESELGGQKKKKKNNDERKLAASTEN